MEDYPRNLREFDLRFVNDEDCREYLRQLRWPEVDPVTRFQIVHPDDANGGKTQRLGG
jgi:hypothetical protein